MVFFSFLVLHTNRPLLYLNLTNHITKLLPSWTLEPCHSDLHYTKFSFPSKTLYKDHLWLKKSFTPPPDKLPLILQDLRPSGKPSPHLLQLTLLPQKSYVTWVIFCLETSSSSKVFIYSFIPSCIQHFMSVTYVLCVVLGGENTFLGGIWFPFAEIFFPVVDPNIVVV